MGSAIESLASTLGVNLNPAEAPLPGSSVGSSSVNGILQGAFEGPMYERTSLASSEVGPSILNDDGKREKDLATPSPRRQALDPSAAMAEPSQAGPSRPAPAATAMPDTPTRESYVSRAGQISNEYASLGGAEQRQRREELREMARDLGQNPAPSSNMSTLVNLVMAGAQIARAVNQFRQP